jgi:hypothetical protein
MTLPNGFKLCNSAQRNLAKQSSTLIDVIVDGKMVEQGVIEDITLFIVTVNGKRFPISDCELRTQ